MPLEETVDEEDLVTIVPTTIAKVGGGAQMFVGLFGLVLALQTSSIVRFRGLQQLILPTMIVGAVALLGLGWKTTKGRGTPAFVGTFVAASYGLLGLAWLVYSFANALFSLVALFLGPASIVAAILSALAIGAGRKADDARERLRAHGLDAGA